MTSKKAMQRSILSSVVAIALCCTMMLGATWAWFTDTIVNTGNTIASGVWGGAVGLEVLNAEGAWVNANTSTAPIFTCTDWKPGDSIARVIKVSNNGNIDLDWEAAVVATENDGGLSDVIDVYYKWDVTDNTTDITGWEYVGTLTECMTNNGLAAKLHGELTAHTEKTFGLALKFQEDADPRYSEQKVVFDFQVLATEVQPWTEEATPDTPVEIEDGAVKTATSITVTPTDDKALVDAIAVTVPAGTKLADGATDLTLTVTAVEEVNSNIQVMAGQETIAMEIKLDGLADDNAEEITVSLTIDKGLSNVALYHYDNLIPSTYDPATGVLTFTTTDFSPFTIVHGEVPAYADSITANGDSYCEPTVEGAVVTIKPEGEIKWALSNFGAASTWNNWVGFCINTPDGVDAAKAVVIRPDGATRILANVLDNATQANFYWGFADKDSKIATYTIDWNADGHVDLTVVIDATEATLELEPFTVTFVGFEGADLGTQTVRKGGAAEAPAAPAVEGYTFKGWNVAFDNVTENLTVTAIYEINQYTVTWIINGVETEETYKYGEIPSWKGEKPTKPADEQYTYEFVDWGEIAPVTGNASYVAIFKHVENAYTIIWTVNGEEFKTETLVYGAAITAPEYEAPANTDQYTYTFSGWTVEEGATVTGNATFDATLTETENKYTITWLINGEEFKTETLAYGAAITAPEYEVPANTDQYTYAFQTWEIAEGATVTGNATFDATLTETVNQYKITWTVNGEEFKTETLAYGAPIVAPAYEVPTNDAQFSYAFQAWNVAEGATVTGNATYEATLTKTVNKYNVTWNVNGATTTEEYEYGATPAFKGSTEKAADVQYTYTFAGWDKALATVTGNAEYVAQYTPVLRSYTITFKNWDGSVLQSTEVAYGAMPAYNGTPVRAEDAQNTYTFKGWDSEIVVVTGAKTYTAQFNATARSLKPYRVDLRNSKRLDPQHANPAFAGLGWYLSDPWSQFSNVNLQDNQNCIDTTNAGAILTVGGTTRTAVNVNLTGYSAITMRFAGNQANTNLHYTVYAGSTPIAEFDIAKVVGNKLVTQTVTFSPITYNGPLSIVASDENVVGTIVSIDIHHAPYSVNMQNVTLTSKYSEYFNTPHTVESDTVVKAVNALHVTNPGELSSTSSSYVAIIATGCANLGQIDLSKYTKVTIRVAAATGNLADARLWLTNIMGHSGTPISSQVTLAKKGGYVVQQVTIDLTNVDYNGTVYLTSNTVSEMIMVTSVVFS